MKILGFIFRLAFVVGLVIWLADRPGSAQIVWRDVVIETSAAVLAVIVAAIAYGLVIVHRLWRFVVDGPRIWGLNRKIGKMEDGQKELAKGLAAIAAGQSSEAGRHAVKARKLLGETPTTRLLLAQSAQLAGDHRAAQTIYKTMTTDADTAVLGYRGLIMSALRDGQLDEAIRLSGQLEATKADVPWLQLVRFEIATRLENWASAGESLSLARKARLLPSLSANKHEAALLLAQAKTALRESAPVKALELAEKARKLHPDWVPAALVLVEAQIVTKHERAALRTIEKAWSKTPNPQFLPLLYWALQTGKPIENYKQVERMTRDNRDSFYSLMALAEAALKADLWGEARRYLITLVNRGDASQMTYQILARLEQRELRNEKAAASWLAKAIVAPPDAMWQCTSCGAAHEYWEASCHSCSAFNRMEWSVPGKSRQLSTHEKPMAMLDSNA